MATYKGNYTDDLGRSHGGSALVTRLYSTGDQPVDLETEETDLLPQIFLDHLIIPATRPCSLPITPRRIRAYLSQDSTIRFEFPIPFIGGSAEYAQFIDEVEANARLLAFDLLPERLPSGLLSWWIR